MPGASAEHVPGCADGGWVYAAWRGLRFQTACKPTRTSSTTSALLVVGVRSSSRLRFFLSPLVQSPLDDGAQLGVVFRSLLAQSGNFRRDGWMHDVEHTLNVSLAAFQHSFQQTFVSNFETSKPDALCIRLRSAGRDGRCRYETQTESAERQLWTIRRERVDRRPLTVLSGRCCSIQGIEPH